jgi:hypothetical protein
MLLDRTRPAWLFDWARRNRAWAAVAQMACWCGVELIEFFTRAFLMLGIGLLAFGILYFLVVYGLLRPVFTVVYLGTVVGSIAWLAYEAFKKTRAHIDTQIKQHDLVSVKQQQ